MKILILGASGMLGHNLYWHFKKKYQVWGTVRNDLWHTDLISGYEIGNISKIEKLISDLKPDYVINCIGIIKQLKDSKDKIVSLEVNSLWPNRLSEICASVNAKMIHFSTDCVFSGNKGNYLESDIADARDLYGLSKYLGEVDNPHTLTLRTSIIGHELNSNVSLVDWFLSQTIECKGYAKAIYTGFPTIEVARFLEDHVLNNFKSGLYHLSSEPIDKYNLLKLIAQIYEKKISIIPSDEVVIDRSLNSDLLRAQFNFEPRSWPLMVKGMHDHFLNSGLYNNKEKIR